MLVETGTFSFEKVSDGPLVNAKRSSISASWADYDNDGDLDVFIANMEAKNQLYRNNGGQFEEVTGPYGGSSDVSAFGSSWGDVDNDGDLDLFVANALSGSQNNALYLNQLMESGAATFTEVETGPVVSDGGWSYGSSFADMDNDGDLDLFVAKWFNSRNENNALFVNQGNGGGYLSLDLKGTTSNRSGLGARLS